MVSSSSLFIKLNREIRNLILVQRWTKSPSCVCAPLCPTLCNPMDCSPPGFSIHGISQARTLEWVVISLSRRSSQLRDWTWVSCVGRQVVYHWATWEASISTIYLSIFFHILFLHKLQQDIEYSSLWKRSESESLSVVSDSLRPHGPYSPWNSPGQNTVLYGKSLLLICFM